VRLDCGLIAAAREIGNVFDYAWRLIPTR
jgi:hypothetical protein